MNYKNRDAGWGLFLLVILSLWNFKSAGQSEVGAPARQLVSANSDFGIRLLQELCRAQPGANLFISPYSISSVLEMLCTGAKGRTREEFERLLGISAMDLDAMNQAYQRLDQSLSEARTDVRLNIANALWYRSGVPLAPDFAAVNQRYYRATLKALDFADPQSVSLMNEWAAQNTEGKITSIIQPAIAADAAMIVANAIYFKGTWLDPFDPKRTSPRPFFSAHGSDRQVPMMPTTRTFSYQQTNEFQAVQLPYTGRRLHMHVLLPATNSSLNELVGKLSADFWRKSILPAYAETRGTVVLPRFTLRYDADLKRPLMTLGLKNAWNSGADFSGLSSASLYLSQVKHQSFVEVNEQGTEAAAVTTGVVALAAFQHQPPPFQMIVDRPFLFVISDQSTGTILFLGAVFDPAA